MLQLQLDLQFPLTQQLSLDLDFPEELMTNLKTPYYSDLLMADGFTGTVNSYLTVNNKNGVEQARIDDTGLSLKVENQSWLKTKVANWLGIKYI